MDLRRYLPPALVIFLLSPLVGEVLSGSTPPLELLNPLTVAFMLFLYGGGAVVIRETALRWHKGWPSILLLGAAYGIVEEGLMVKSFFNPQWIDIGVLGSYGRWAGVNWVWSMELTIFHAVYSITIPILIVSLLYPKKRDEAWARPRTLVVLAILFLATVIIGYFGLMPYPVPPLLYLLAMAAIVALIALAYLLPYPLFKARDVKAPGAGWFFLLGLIMGTSFFIVNWAVPEMGVSPIVVLLLDILWVMLYAFALLRMSGGGRAWTGRHQIATAAGTLGFLMFLDVLLEIGGMLGMSVVGIGFALLMAWTYVTVGRPGWKAAEGMAACN